MDWKDRFPQDNRYFETENGILYNFETLDFLKRLPDESIDCIITSPPYWGLRDYGVENQIGLEPTLGEYLKKLLRVTGELKRILKNTGVMFWNHGDCYGGSGCGKGDYRNNNKRSSSNPNLYCEKPNPHSRLTPKCMVLQNYRLIFRMVDEQGWILRNIIIWHKANHMPESVRDRFTKSYEPVFMLVKNKKYWFDLDTVRIPHKETSIERAKRGVGSNHKYANLPHYGGGGGINKPRPNIRHNVASYDDFLYNRPLHPLGKNPGDVWSIPTQPFSAKKLGISNVDHFATFPEKLVEPMMKAGCPEKGIVLDPFLGSGTTAVVAEKLNRKWLGVEINPKYCEIAKERIRNELKQIGFNF